MSGWGLGECHSQNVGNGSDGSPSGSAPRGGRWEILCWGERGALTEATGSGEDPLRYAPIDLKADQGKFRQCVIVGCHHTAPSCATRANSPPVATIRQIWQVGDW